MLLKNWGNLVQSGMLLMLSINLKICKHPERSDSRGFLVINYAERTLKKQSCMATVFSWPSSVSGQRSAT